MQEQEARAKVKQSIIDGLKKLNEQKKINAKSRYKMPKAEQVVLKRNESVMAREARNVRQHSMANAEKLMKQSFDGVM
jgi:hypothetical protein